MIVNHKVYGKMSVDADELAKPDAFILAKHVTRTGPDLYVGKAALDEKGGYVPKKRADKTRIEKYLPLVYAAVAKMCRDRDDYDELWCEGALGLCEADMRYDEKNNAAFASFAKPYISGFIYNAQNSARNGWGNEERIDDWSLVSDEATVEEKLMVGSVYEAFDTLTPKQKYVMEGLYIHGYTQEALADKMGVTRIAVLQIAERATVAVRKHLGLQ